MSESTQVKLLSTTDARVWAREFNRVFVGLAGHRPLDEGWLIGWFANAIETGRSAGLRAARSTWQPIETAPRDGTIIIGCTVPPARDLHMARAMRWSKYGWERENSDGMFTVGFNEASFWIPFPEPLAAERRK